MDDLTPIVLEFGSHSIRSGFGNSKIPSFITPPIFGKVIGDQIYEDHPQIQYSSPFRRGKVVSWPAFEDLLDFCIQKQLKLGKLLPSECSLTISQSLAASKEEKKKLLEILFEKYNFGAVHVTSDAEMAFMDSGKDIGIIVQIGHEITTIVAMVDGKPLPLLNKECGTNEFEIMELAGIDITNYLSDEMKKRGIDLLSPKGQRQAEKFKADYCFFTDDFDAELQKLERNSPMPIIDEVDTESVAAIPFEFSKANTPIARRMAAMFSAPVPKMDWIDQKRPFEAPEILFQPDILELEMMPLADRVFKVIAENGNIYRQPILYQNIVVSGGTAKIRGIKERLTSSLEFFCPQKAKVVVSYPHEKDPANFDGGYNSEDSEVQTNPSLAPGIGSLELSAFRGGCKMTQMPNFISLRKSKKDYLENPFPILRTSGSRKSVRLSRPESMTFPQQIE